MFNKKPVKKKRSKKKKGEQKMGSNFDYTKCYGPCYYSCSPVTTFLSYAALSYVGACIGYVLLTKTTSLGATPFADSLTTHQKKIKAESARSRYVAFFVSLFASIVFLVFLRPFSYA